MVMMMVVFIMMMVMISKPSNLGTCPKQDPLSHFFHLQISFSFLYFLVLDKTFVGLDLNPNPIFFRMLFQMLEIVV